MVNSNKIIYLLYEGLPVTVIESQVINHVLAMREAGINVELWSFACTRSDFKVAKYREQVLRKKGFNLRLFRGVRAAIPFSIFMNALLLAIAIKRWGMGVRIIHARTEFSASIASLIKVYFKYMIIWDARGDTFAEAMLLSESWPWYKKILLKYKLFRTERNLLISRKYSDYALFVTEELQQILAPQYPRTKSSVISCAANADQFYFDPELRRRKRSDLGIATNEYVFIYSGSLTKWQCFPETVDLLRPLMELHSHIKFVILTPSPAEALVYFPRSIQSQVICKSVGLQEVNSYLNASDIAIFLRNENAVNFVASPVKYAEYCMAGLPIIMTKAVKSACKTSKQLENIVWENYLPQLPDRFSDEKRLNLSSCAAELLSRQKMNPVYLKIYSRLLESNGTDASNCKE